MNFVEYPDRDMMMIDVASRLAGDLEECLLTHETASFAVPGGTTPGPVFDALCAARLDWDRVHVMLTDERWVPETSDRSNTALLRARLLTNSASNANFVPFYTGESNPDDAMAGLGETIAPHLPISVLLLGMGADMHTASLFPGADQLDLALSPDAPPVLAMRAPGAPEPRVTLTGPVLEGAMNTHVLITGADKRTAFEAAERLDPHEAPIKTVLSHATVHWAP